MLKQRQQNKKVVTMIEWLRNLQNHDITTKTKTKNNPTIKVKQIKSIVKEKPVVENKE